jgi:hypothetical protein
MLEKMAESPLPEANRKQSLSYFITKEQSWLYCAKNNEEMKKHWQYAINEGASVPWAGTQQEGAV